MSARSGLAGKRPSRPHLGPSQAIFCVGRKNPKITQILPIFLGGPMGPIHPLWANGQSASASLQLSIFTEAHFMILSLKDLCKDKWVSGS